MTAFIVTFSEKPSDPEYYRPAAGYEFTQVILAESVEDARRIGERKHGKHYTVKEVRYAPVRRGDRVEVQAP